VVALAMVLGAGFLSAEGASLDSAFSFLWFSKNSFLSFVIFFFSCRNCSLRAAPFFFPSL
jgi:hypothetical protein